jgi:hypothetical protein
MVYVAMYANLWTDSVEAVNELIELENILEEVEISDSEDCSIWDLET